MEEETGRDSREKRQMTDKQNPFEGVRAELQPWESHQRASHLRFYRGEEQVAKLTLDRRIGGPIALRWNAYEGMQSEISRLKEENERLKARNEELDALTEYYAGQTDAALRSNKPSKDLQSKLSAAQERIEELEKEADNTKIIREGIVSTGKLLSDVKEAMENNWDAVGMHPLGKAVAQAGMESAFIANLENEKLQARIKELEATIENQEKWLTEQPASKEDLSEIKRLHKLLLDAKNRITELQKPHSWQVGDSDSSGGCLDDEISYALDGATEENTAIVECWPFHHLPKKHVAAKYIEDQGCWESIGEFDTLEEAQASIKESNT